jgi:hypothetical protein
MFPASDIIDLLQARASTGRVAFEIVDDMFAKVIVVLQQRFGIGYLETELLLVDLIREHENTLYAALRDHVRLSDAEDAVRLCLPGTGED